MEYLFGPPTPEPQGFKYQKEFITREEERMLIEHVAALPLAPYQHEVEGQVYEGKRRVYNYGEENEPFPDWLQPLREKVAAFAGHRRDELVQAHLIEYSPGAPIGWHRDSPPYEKVVGVSLLSPCRFQLRRKRADGKFDRFEITAEPRSIYVMAGESRSVWQHGIPPVEHLRYSITFRTNPP
ncbi:MAG: alpha-ketoglutarate-dependent dioxygenase AlkB [Candidatus Kaiserbacteria bacterium]|nr:alpha-ketoglutarate-dependent dioxygenase AlkB [Candidatus Kaiserbacteria bacterium]